MKATGEVMGIDADLGMAFLEIPNGSVFPPPTEGNVFISLKDRDKKKRLIS